jgi:hypothetical protein
MAANAMNLDVLVMVLSLDGSTYQTAKRVPLTMKAHRMPSCQPFRGISSHVGLGGAFVCGPRCPGDALFALPRWILQSYGSLIG